MTTILQAPPLAHDALMLSRFGSKVGIRGKAERLVVWNFLKHMERSGYRPWAVNDGDENVTTHTPLEVMEIVFNLDEACIGFVRKKSKQIGRNEVGNVVIVFGNEPEELLSDWRWNNGPVGEKFEYNVSAFNPEEYI